MIPDRFIIGSRFLLESIQLGSDGIYDTFTEEYLLFENLYEYGSMVNINTGELLDNTNIILHKHNGDFWSLIPYAMSEDIISHIGESYKIYLISTNEDDTPIHLYTSELYTNNLKLLNKEGNVN